MSTFTEKEFDLTHGETPAQSENQIDELLVSLGDAAVELAGYASYAEIVGGVSHNRQDIRKWCDKIFETKRQLDECFDRNKSASLAVAPRKWRVICAATKKELMVTAATYKEACDLIIDEGWSHDDLLGALVCPEARVI